MQLSKAQLEEQCRKLQAHLTDVSAERDSAKKQLAERSRRLKHSEVHSRQLRAALIEVEPTAVGRAIIEADLQIGDMIDESADDEIFNSVTKSGAMSTNGTTTADLVELSNKRLQTQRILLQDTEKENDSLQAYNHSKTVQLEELQQKLLEATHQETSRVSDFQKFTQKLDSVRWENNIVIQRFQDQSNDLRKAQCKNLQFTRHKRKFHEYAKSMRQLEHDLDTDSEPESTNRAKSARCSMNDLSGPEHDVIQGEPSSKQAGEDVFGAKETNSVGENKAMTAHASPDADESVSESTTTESRKSTESFDKEAEGACDDGSDQEDYEIVGYLTDEEGDLPPGPYVRFECDVAGRGYRLHR